MSGTFGYIRFSPDLVIDIIEKVLDELKSKLSDVEWHQWEHRIDIGDPMDFKMIDFVVSTIKNFEVEDFVADIAFNCN